MNGPPDPEPGAAPPPPSSSSPNPSDAGPPPSSDDRTLALLAHLLGIFFSIFGALIIWLVKKDTSPFVDDQAKEALNFQLTVLIAYAVAGVTTCLGVGFVLLAVTYFGNIVLCIMAAVAANRGERYRYPLTLRLLK